MELEVLPGLKDLAVEELGSARILPDDDPDAVRVDWERGIEPLLELRLASAAHRLLHFDIRRPRQLLGDQDFRRLVAAITEVRNRSTFTGIRLSAAGSDSAVFRRLKQELARAVALPVDDAEGDLLLRVRPSVVEPAGWDVLVRLTRRPLATRAWRAVNMRGALNATIAAAMVRLSRPQPGDRVLNLMCGSGTLLAERASAGRASVLTGADAAPSALAAARKNLPEAELVRADARNLPFGAGGFDVILADLPWGELSGSHSGNRELYPAALAEAARVAAPAARLVLITHEVRLMERCLGQQAAWRQERELTVFQGGLHPRIHLLVREPAR